MGKTKKGVYHNLKESKYTVSNTEIVFFFSSQFYLNKFLVECQSNRDKFNERMTKLMGTCPLNFNMLADIQLYEAIEKRGFRATLKCGTISSDELYRYALRKMTESKTLEWVETPAESRYMEWLRSRQN